MHFETRQDFIQYATVAILCAQDFKTDTNAKDNALRLAQEVADLFFDKNVEQQRAGGGHDVYNERPEVKAPPQVRTVNPAVPGQTTNPVQGG